MRVSILIPCFNAERWIGAAIDSALAQGPDECEVIVVDDGSIDGSAAVIASYGDRIVFERGPNRGGNAARNRLLALARGEWVQYLDADDFLLPGKVGPQLAFVAAHPDVDVVYGPVTLQHERAPAPHRELLPIPEPHDPWILLARWFLPQTGAPLWRKAALEAVGGWKDDQPRCQEHELYLRLLIAGARFAYCDSNGAVYRQWSEETLWKRDRAATRAARMDIVQRLEAHLRSTGELTPARLWAINQGRFELARSAWPIDRREAEAIMSVIRSSQPDFAPGGLAAPRPYQMLYRWFGFSIAERLAAWRRQIKSQAPVRAW